MWESRTTRRAVNGNTSGPSVKMSGWSSSGRVRTPTALRKPGRTNSGVWGIPPALEGPCEGLFSSLQFPRTATKKEGRIALCY